MKRPMRGMVGWVLACVIAGAAAAPALAEPAWPTYHHDAGRSGVDPEAGESVEPLQAWQSPPLGAPIWGQPLVLGSRVYVATVGDRLYALEASSGKVIWEKSAGVPVPSSELPCGDITPTVGIVGTPVIDTSTNVIYAVADTWDASKKEAHHVLKGYALSGGEEVLSTPVDPAGSDPKALLQRTALNLDGGGVVFGFGGNDGDCGNYRGTVVAAPVGGGAAHFWQYQPAAPAFSGAGVWGPSGPAVDGEGRIYASTGNPNTSGGEAATYDYSDSLLQLSPEAKQLGSFKPPSWKYDSNHDIDLGSAGPELLPAGIIFQAAKNGIGYLIGAATMSSEAPALYEATVCGGLGSFGGDAYAAGVIYIPCSNGTQALAYNQSAHTFSPLWKGPSDAKGPPILTAGLVWTVAGGGGATKLYGLEPATGSPRYTLTLPSPVADHFPSPSAASGRLFLATGESVSAYRIAQPSPAVSTGAATSIARTSATLHASVDPNGFEVSECKFEYGPTTSYGSSAPCTPAPGSGESPVAVSAAIGGLAANTTYHFRIFAKNAGGTSTGSDQTFKTLSQAPPTVVTEPASAVAQTSATAHGTVNPNGSQVSECAFEYGPTEAYGSNAACSSLPGSGNSPVAVSAALESLAEGATYHFRIVATSALGGTSFGADRSFTTTLVLGPHWYRNGARLPEGSKFSLLAWGTLTLQNASTGAVKCKTVAGVQVENPSGGGAGKGTLLGVASYGCVAPACESAGGKAEMAPEKLPWSSVLIEEAALFRDKLEGIGLRAICAAREQSVLFHGSLRPEAVNGFLIGAAPSKLEFGAGSGSLESTVGAGELSGKLKLMGYEAAQLTQVRNP